MRSKDDGHKEFACDLCGKREAVEVPYVRQYTKGQVIHICKNCGFIYVKMRRSLEKVAEVWSKEMFGKEYTCKTPLMIARHNYVAEFLDQKIGLKNKKLFDIGAGEGQFLNLLKAGYNASVFGIEPSGVNCGIMNKLRINCFQGTLEAYIKSHHSKKHQADIATLTWTLENATSCKDILFGARQVIKDGGYLVVATGSRILVPFVKPLNLYLSPSPADVHPARFSINTLTSLLAIAGFKVV
ncbi:MAG: methyltransferase domain-containing protein, partial [Candidatus Omnitrophica bacterium]|nr:methyltransferase domain-containing protein [Candidatus Omnitrophota bacterium]